MLNPATGLLRLSSAGHPLAVFAPAQGAPRLVEATGPPIGVSQAARYAEEVIQLEAGDRLVVFTDGLCEAVSPGGEDFGFERVLHAVTARRGSGVHELVEALAEEGLRWAGGAAQDDISVLAVQSTPPGPGEK